MFTTERRSDDWLQIWSRSDPSPSYVDLNKPHPDLNRPNPVLRPAAGTTRLAEDLASLIQALDNNVDVLRGVLCALLLGHGIHRQHVGLAGGRARLQFEILGADHFEPVLVLSLWLCLLQWGDERDAGIGDRERRDVGELLAKRDLSGTYRLNRPRRVLASKWTMYA